MAEKRIETVEMRAGDVKTGFGNPRKITKKKKDERLALSFRVMKDDDKCHIRVVPPLLRREVLLYESCKGDYVHGYMVNSGFGENIMEWHKKHPDIPLHFFWDKWEEEPVKKVLRNTLRLHTANRIPQIPSSINSPPFCNNSRADTTTPIEKNSRIKNASPDFSDLALLYQTPISREGDVIDGF